MATTGLASYNMKGGLALTESEILGVFQQAIIVALKLGGPLLLVSIVLGLVVAIFQAATQIHEQTLTFVPKIVASVLLLWIMGSWMINVLNDFVRELFVLMSQI